MKVLTVAFEWHSAYVCVLCPSAPITRHIVPTILLIHTLYAETRAMV